MNGILIGRFQPFHLGHLEAVIFGLTKVDTLFIGIGSSNKSHQDRNPFTADERKEMILSSLEEKIQERVSIYYIPDSNDHSKWADSIDKIIPSYDIVFSNDDFTHELFEKHKKKVI
jgi:nicotinamide-nucleotide adenylyltransferase